MIGMFISGMVVMYMITGIILVVEGFSTDWLLWLFGWWLALPIMLTYKIIKEIKKIRRRGR